MRGKKILRVTAVVLCLLLSVGIGVLLPDSVFYLLDDKQQEQVSYHQLNAVELKLTSDLSLYDKMALVASVLDNGTVQMTSMDTISTEQEIELAAWVYLQQIMNSFMHEDEVDFEFAEPCLYTDNATQESILLWNVGLSLYSIYHVGIVMDDETRAMLSVQIEIMAPVWDAEEESKMEVTESDMFAIAENIAGILKAEDSTAVWVENEEANQYMWFEETDTEILYYMEMILIAQEGEQHFRFYTSITADGVYFNRGFEGYEDYTQHVYFDEKIVAAFS